ncbi:MAG: hypothetical protein JSR83_15840 [Proteobacteria bacterium]|nr:hypothetical protein [Pseudomonadota bacterium]
MPANQREKLHIPMIVPHLQGRYRERPHMLRVAAALKQLGYRQIRVWSGADAGRRFWIPTTPK